MLIPDFCQLIFWHKRFEVKIIANRLEWSIKNSEKKILA